MNGQETKGKVNDVTSGVPLLQTHILNDLYVVVLHT